MGQTHDTTQAAVQTGYYVADEPHSGDTGLWRDADDTRPALVAYKAELDRMDPVLWPTLVAALTDAPETVEAVARHLYLTRSIALDWENTSDGYREAARQMARDLLAELREHVTSQGGAR